MEHIPFPLFKTFTLLNSSSETSGLLSHVTVPEWNLPIMRDSDKVKKESHKHCQCRIVQVPWFGNTRGE